MKIKTLHKSIFILLNIMIFITCNAQDNSENEFINNLLDQLTLEEKISMIHGNSKFTNSGIERLGIPEWTLSDGPHGVREEINRHDWDAADWDNDFATYLPVGTALASTWNPELTLEYGKTLGREARARGKDVILGPGINIHRTPLCGRNFEYMSEDPHLISQLVVPYIKGVQQEDVAACVKHYAANNQEYERFRVNVEMDERTLREIYLPGFESAIVEGKALTVMAAYNKFRGEWCSENKYLLTDILKKEWNFDGVVMSDWDGTHSTINAAIAGLDLEMGTNKDSYSDYFFADALLEAVNDGEVSVATIDDKVRRILTVMYRSNVFNKNRSTGEFISERNFEVAKNVASESIVLLKNENSILPLNKNELKSIAVIGENAVLKQAHGGGSSAIKAKYEITPLEGLKNKLGEDYQINFAEGYRSSTTFDWSEGRVDTAVNSSIWRAELRSKAVQAAKSSDYVIMFLGLNHHFDMESVDRIEMSLPYEQDELVNDVLNVNKNIIIVLISGQPVEMNKWIDKVPAVLQGWYAGSEAGNVFADILFGDTNPSGKLPFTFPKKLEDVPAYKFGDVPGKGLEVEYKEGIFVGYRYYDTFNIEPQYAFGHGLSYTKFNYSSAALIDNNFKDDGTITISVDVKNIGEVIGKEVVQLYIEDLEASVERPTKELKSFTKIELKPGETRKVDFVINEKMLSFFDVSKNEFYAEPGKFKAHIGSSSKDIKQVVEFNF